MSKKKLLFLRAVLTPNSTTAGLHTKMEQQTNATKRMHIVLVQKKLHRDMHSQDHHATIWGVENIKTNSIDGLVMGMWAPKSVSQAD